MENFSNGETKMLFKDVFYADENFAPKTGSVLVIDTKIAWVGEGVPEGYLGKIYDGRGKVLLPGFYNTHCHVPMVLLRGLGEGLPLDRWLFEAVFPFEAKLTPEDIYWAAMLGISEMVRSGIVSFTDMYFHTSHIARAVDESGVKMNSCNAMTAFSPSDYRTMRAFRDCESVRKHAATLRHGRIIADAGIHGEYTSYPEIVSDVAAYAKENGMRMQLHLSETQKEHEECKARRGVTPAAYFERLGVFDAPTTAAHCVWVEDSDIEILRAKAVTAAHCPSSNLKLGSGIAPVWKMRQAGVNVGIGTDGASSNNNLNGLEEINLASILQRGANLDPSCMDIATTLRMACENGARSQGRDDCGSIKAGNRADLVMFSMEAPHLQPAADPIANVLYAAQASDVCLTMVDGKVLYRYGEFLTIDIERVIAEVNAAQQRILASL
jgi:5-methylthioadenosine/S-adenosylhomocysteine deaminase